MCFLSVTPVCHALISFSFFPPSLFRCSSLSFFLRPTTVTPFFFFALLLSCLFVHSDLLPWCTLLSRADAGSYFWLFVPIARILVYTHVTLTPPPPPPTTQIRNSRTAPPNEGSTHKNTHLQKTWHAFVLMSVCLRAEILPRNDALSGTEQKTAMSAFVQREEEIQSCCTETVCAHTDAHIHFLTSCAVLFDPMSIVRSGQRWFKDIYWPSKQTLYRGLTHGNAHARTHFQLMCISLSVDVTAKIHLERGMGDWGKHSMGKKGNQYKALKTLFILLSRTGIS